MSRLPRLKIEGEDAWYHLWNHSAGRDGEYPFQEDPQAANELLMTWEEYLRLYFCRQAAFTLMGNHYHAVVRFEKFRELSPEELQDRAERRFGSLWKWKTRHWDESRWKSFNRDLFDVSRFMKHVNGEFSKKYNRRTGRRGHFWRERFGSLWLSNLAMVRAEVVYVELNPIRARIADRPEDHPVASARWRMNGEKDDLLVPLEELWGLAEEAFSEYRETLYRSGAESGSKGGGRISEQDLAQEEARGFHEPGVFARRHAWMSAGLALGNREVIAELLEKYRKAGVYRRRRNPVPHFGGAVYTLRANRRRRT